MKKILSKLKLHIIAPACLMLAVVGCTTQAPPAAFVTTQPVVSQTPVVATNPVTLIVVTNLIPVTNFVPVTNYVAQPFTVDTNKIGQIVQAGQSVGTAVGVFNPAIGMTVTGGMGLVGTLLFGISTAVAAYKNQSNKNILQAVIQGVEGASPVGGNDATPITLAAVKQSIQNEAVNSGVQPALHAIVTANT